MKTNCISDVTKIIIFAATVIIVCVLCAVGFKTANEGKSIANQGSTQFNAMTSEYQDINKSIYDGSTVLGTELVSLIKKTIEKGEYLSIVVKTRANSTETHYNYRHMVDTNGNHSISNASASTFRTEVTTRKENSDFINPSAQFLGKIYKDANNNVICIEFIQQE